jgi:hypothetical protein
MFQTNILCLEAVARWVSRGENAAEVMVPVEMIVFSSKLDESIMCTLLSSKKHAKFDEDARKRPLQGAALLAAVCPCLKVLNLKLAPQVFLFLLLFCVHLDTSHTTIAESAEPETA